MAPAEQVVFACIENGVKHEEGTTWRCCDGCNRYNAQ